MKLIRLLVAKIEAAVPMQKYGRSSENPPCFTTSFITADPWRFEQRAVAGVGGHRLGTPRPAGRGRPGAPTAGGAPNTGGEIA